MKQAIKLIVNGKDEHLEVEPRDTLLQVLRERLHLTGAKESCSSGECGTCSVLVDGAVVNSCLTLAVEVDGSTITTIEGLANGERLQVLQEKFVEKGAVQCGFCSPGMILSAKNLLDNNPHPTEAEVKRAIAGNACRCTGYTKIVEAILSASEAVDGQPSKTSLPSPARV